MKKLIQSIILMLLVCTGSQLLYAETTNPATAIAGGKYTAVVEGYDWGPAVSKVILSLEETVTSVDWKDYTVSVERKTDCVEIPADQASGERQVVYAYVSNAEGARFPEGKFVTLVLAVAPNQPLGSPIQYSRNENCRGNNWIDYHMKITQQSSDRVWDQESDRIVPLIDRFDLNGKFKHKGTTLSYAAFAPDSEGEKSPLIIWLHGGGEGGTDPSIPLIANRAANYASDEIQAIFGGAYVLSPQSPTYWMDNGEGMTRGKDNDIYNEAVMALIRKYVADHPDIDTDRIYVGGCSNGGYLTLKLVLEHPDYFAAAFPSALAYHSEFVSDEQIESIKNVPIWFIQSKDDPVTIPDDTAVPVYHRLVEAGAPNVHFSYYDHVVDITGFFGGKDYHYNGHWSWIYSHANQARLDFDGKPVLLDGRPVTIMEWMAAQSK
ncbi:prolyl oligopeptidase family serine peptidase [Flavilitoribacter nigricans]|uniref:Glucan-binding protein n=1 Tax=Flavilitoribacter nigricans (strain ATCC 23147 / DSM 23189 / NBRC 102662 / NCIMB 1420 / SS-2) TaxID=1122177 RepID=A0A2D0NE81_FLAN2|nr:prolyl oligopeptidase family serine peptidase [Flavilitoribacter nigricans]PHN06777.1 glucan-binding protein [Flavilitoribacter nigricans DSM 23189 = NBRC 102662]